MIVAVTGASGFLGRPLCARLLRGGHEVRALVRDPEGFARTMPAVRVGRCVLPDEIDEALLRGADVVVHAAWATRETDQRRARRVNEDGTRRLFEVARRCGVPRVVFVSTVAAAADAPSFYARSKYAMEALCDPQRDLVLRPGLILAREGTGLFQQLARAARVFHVVPLFGGGRQPLQTVHVDDLCEGIVRALERELGGALNCAEPHPLDVRAFFRVMTRQLGIRAVFVPLPFGPVLLLLRLAEALRVPLPLRAESLRGLAGLRQVPVADDLRRLELRVRSAAESLAGLA